MQYLYLMGFAVMHNKCLFEHKGIQKFEAMHGNVICAVKEIHEGLK